MKDTNTGLTMQKAPIKGLREATKGKVILGSTPLPMNGTNTVYVVRDKGLIE
jgi:hypothetical protein